MLVVFYDFLIMAVRFFITSLCNNSCFQVISVTFDVASDAFRQP